MIDADYKSILEEIEPILTGMGIQVVELKVGRTKHLENVQIVIYKEEGVTLEDCTQASRVIKPQLDLLEGFENLNLQITSPGIDRVIKNRSEYAIFNGRGIKILTKDSPDWVSGIIQKVEGDLLTLRKQEKETVINMGNIKKAKLDYTEEVEDR